jgi:hypothetical protein
MTERALNPDTQPYPTRSKMVDTYLADVAWKLATAQVNEARKLAVRLPQIGVALSNAELHSSQAAYEDWCAKWVGSTKPHATYAQWFAEAGESAGESADQTPFAALQALRLRRTLREVPPPQLPPTSVLPLEDQPAAEDCEALLHAARKWYGQEGRHDPVVQSNLARLGVLR